MLRLVFDGDFDRYFCVNSFISWGEYDGLQGILFTYSEKFWPSGDGVGIYICWEFPKTGVPGLTKEGETLLWINFSTDPCLVIGGDIKDLTYVLWDLICAGGWTKGE